jgi:hypothetical protein
MSATLAEQIAAVRDNVERLEEIERNAGFEPHRLAGLRAALATSLAREAAEAAAASGPIALDDARNLVQMWAASTAWRWGEAGRVASLIDELGAARLVLADAARVVELLDELAAARLVLATYRDRVRELAPAEGGEADDFTEIAGARLDLDAAGARIAAAREEVAAGAGPPGELRFKL